MRKKKVFLIAILCLIALLICQVFKWYNRNAQWIHMVKELKENNYIIENVSRVDSSYFFSSNICCSIYIYVDKNSDFKSIEKAFLNFKVLFTNPKLLEEMILHNRNYNSTGDMPYVTVDFRYNDESDGLLYRFKTDMWCKYQEWHIEYAIESKYKNKTY